MTSVRGWFIFPTEARERSPMLRPISIAESVLYVDDLDRSVEFYTRLLNSNVVRRDERFAALRIAVGQVLLLFRRGASSQPQVKDFGTVPPHDGNGQLHVCFGIGADEVNAWEAKLASLEVAIESRINWPGGAISLYFRDPDSNAVELATSGLWEAADLIP